MTSKSTWKRRAKAAEKELSVTLDILDELMGIKDPKNGKKVYYVPTPKEEDYQDDE